MDEPIEKDEDVDLEPLEDLDDPLLPPKAKKKKDDDDDTLDPDADESADEIADLEDMDEEEEDQW